MYLGILAICLWKYLCLSFQLQAFPHNPNPENNWQFGIIFCTSDDSSRAETYWRKFLILYVPCIILQYVYNQQDAQFFSD